MILMQLAVIVLCAVWSLVAAAALYAWAGGMDSLCLLIGVVLVYAWIVVTAVRTPTGMR